MGLSSHQQSLFHGLIESARKQLPKLVVGSLLIGAGIAFYTNRVERINQLFLQPDIVTAGIDEVSSNTKPLIRQIRKLPKRVKKLMEMIPHQEVNEEEASLFDMSWLLFASVIYVPVFQKIPGGLGDRSGGWLSFLLYCWSAQSCCNYHREWPGIISTAVVLQVLQE
ncbi:hypothetical protein ACSBR2_016683 [Camellia fascicularis]